MHILLMLSSIFLIILANFLAFRALPYLSNWLWRRDLQFGVIAVPVMSLGANLAILLHFANRDCFLYAPTWDHLLSISLLLAMAGCALIAIGIGIIRLVALRYFLARHAVSHAPMLQAVLNRHCRNLSIAHVELYVCVWDRPLAVVYGFRSPKILLSTWMLQHLDSQELEAVLTHELGHVLRRDTLMIWLATILRDAFFYLPTSWTAYRRLQHEKELACDDWAIAHTKRPLALASALAKVWNQTVSGPVLAQSFTGTGSQIELRIERLLELSDATAYRSRPYIIAFSASVITLVILLGFQAANTVMFLAFMECGPFAWFMRMHG